MVFISKEKNILKTAKILPLLLNYGMRSTIDFLLFVIPKSETFFLSDLSFVPSTDLYCVLHPKVYEM